MREDRVHQFCFGGFEVHGDDEALDELGHLGSDQMRAEEIKKYDGLADNCMVGNISAGEIRRRISSPEIHREEGCG